MKFNRIGGLQDLNAADRVNHGKQLTSQLKLTILLEMKWYIRAETRPFLCMGAVHVNVVPMEDGLDMLLYVAKVIKSFTAKIFEE